MNRIAIIAVLLLAACSDQDGARSTLTKAGYTDIDTSGGYAWFGCGQDDTWATEFKAKGPTGHEVEGVVCRGFWAKGATIRFD